jgi:predicted nuclease with TOPRIM domain
MFISNKEKADISEKFDSHKFQIDNLVKHVAEIQVDMGKTDVVHLDDVRESNSKLQKMYWGADKKIKTLEKRTDYLERTVDTLENTLKALEKAPKTVHTLEKTVTVLEGTVNSLQVSNEVLYKQNQNRLELILELKKRVDKLEAKKVGRPVGVRNKLVIPAEKVQAFKDAGVWDDPIKRINSIDQFIKDEAERKEQQKIQKRREAGKRYYAKKKAMKAAQKEKA